MHLQVLNSKNKPNPKSSEENEDQSNSESETKKKKKKTQIIKITKKQLDLWEDKQELQTHGQSKVEEGSNTVRGEDGVIKRYNWNPDIIREYF